MNIKKWLTGTPKAPRTVVKEKPPTVEDIELIEKQAKEAEEHGALYQRQAKAVEALAEATEAEQAGKADLAQAQMRLKQAKGGR